MNSKAIAVIMAVAMAAVGFSVVIADDAAADPIPLDRVTVEVGDSDASTVIGINEGNYTGYKYTLTWTLSISESYQTITVKDTINSNPILTTTLYVKADGTVQTGVRDAAFSLALTGDEDNIGQYNVTITGIAETNSVISYKLQSSITVQTADGDEIEFENFATYNGSVNVIPKNENNELSLTLDDDGAQIGKYFEKSIAFQTGSTMVVSDYDWYAVGLPAGLTMASNGQVSGIPTAASSVSAENPIHVFATDRSGNIYHGTITGFDIAKKDTAVDVNGFGYYINDKVDGANKATYIFSNNVEKIQLHLTNAEGNDITTGLGGYTVRVINDNGTIDNLGPVEGQTYYKLPHSGSGAYTVAVTLNSTGATATFTVYIVGNAMDITASIVIEGA